jgi:hypothetical protein
MNCFYHPEQTAVAQCGDCGKGLCTSCASLFSPPVCKACFNRRVNFSRSEIIKEMLITFGFGAILTFFLLKGGMFQLDFSSYPKSAVLMTILTFYAVSGIIPGWKALTAITPHVFLSLPLLGWLFYFLIKFILAFFVGFVALPIRAIRNVIKLNTLKPAI